MNTLSAVLYDKLYCYNYMHTMLAKWLCGCTSRLCLQSCCCCFNCMSVLRQEPQGSEEDPGETLKRTLKAQRQKRKKRVHIPLAPSQSSFPNSKNSGSINDFLAYVSCLNSLQPRSPMMIMKWQRYPQFSHTVKMRDQLRRRLNQWFCQDLQLVLREVSVHVFIKSALLSTPFGCFRTGYKHFGTSSTSNQ